MTYNDVEYMTPLEREWYCNRLEDQFKKEKEQGIDSNKRTIRGVI